MIIEHTFVTTLEHEEALACADEYLIPLGFRPVMQASERAAAGPVFREWQRGKEKSTKASVPTELPQRLRLDFDRGRVTMAYSVTFTNSAKAAKLHKASALALCTGVDHLLTGAGSCDALIAEVRELESQLDRRSNRTRKVVAIVVGSIVMLIVGVVGVAVLSTL